MTTKWENYTNKDSYTLVPHTETFDVASALTSDFACTTSISYIPEWDFTATYCEQYTVPPTAASTSIAYRTAAKPFPSGGVIPVSDARFYDLYSDGQLAATTSISVAPNKTFIATSATPYIHFTAYEIEKGNRTETIQLSSALVYPYSVKALGQDATATGQVPEELLQQIPQSDCDAGQLQATVTVVFVVDLIYQNFPELDPFIVHFESTALGFDDPIIVNVQDTSVGVPLTMDDWDLPGAPTKPTPVAGPNPNNAQPTPTGRAGNNNNNNGQGAASNEGQVPSLPLPSSVTVGNIGTIPVVIGPGSQVVVGSQTLQPGAPPVIVGGVTPVSLAPSATAIVFAGTTSQLPQIFNPPAPEPVRAPPVLTIGSSTFVPNAATQFFLAPGQILTPGGTAVLGGTVISLAPSASFVVVGTSTSFLPFVSNAPAVVFDGSTFLALPPPVRTANPGNNNQNNGGSGPTFVIGGQTLAPGGQAIVVSGSTISLASGGSSIVVNGVTSAVGSGIVTPQPTISLDSGVFTPVAGSGSTFVIADQTLAPGGPAITVSGTVLSLAPSASFVVINGATSVLANPTVPQITAAPILTIGNGFFRPLPGTGTSYLVGSQILTPGGSVVVADTTISLAPGATALIINGQTSIITPPSQPVITNAPLLTIGSQTYTAISGTTFVIGGQTLTPGGVITVDGTTISLAPGATELVYGSAGQSTTSALFPATTTRALSSTTVDGPSAGASGTNRLPGPTSTRASSASLSKLNIRMLSCLTFAAVFFLF